MAKTTISRIGILTGGGDCPGLNAVIRAVAKTLMHQQGAEILGFLDGYDGLVTDRTRPIEWETVSNILTLGGTILGTSNTVGPELPNENLIALFVHARTYGVCKCF